MRRRSVVSALVASALGVAAVDACSTFDAEPTPPPVDGGNDDGAVGPDTGDGATVDAMLDGGEVPKKCRWDAPFLRAAPLAGNVNSALPELGARLTSNELTLLFHRDEGALDTLYVATREQRDASFAVRGPLGLSAPGVVSAANGSLSSDGKTIYVDALYAGSRDIFFAQRSSETQAFGPLEPVPSLGRLGELEAEPFISDRELFVTYQTGTSASIWVSKLDGLGGYGARVPVPGITTDAGGNRGRAVLSADGLVIYFAWQTPDYDIWAARRPAVGARFDPPTKMTGAEINSTATEAPGWISDDECRLYFSTLRDPANGYEIWVAERAP